jgi:hypothetical protein
LQKYSTISQPTGTSIKYTPLKGKQEVRVPGPGLQACNPSVPEAETGGSHIQGHPGLHCETLLKKKEEEQKRVRGWRREREKKEEKEEERENELVWILAFILLFPSLATG